MADDVLRSFMMSLGYQVDATSEKKFQNSLRSATLQAELMGRAIAAAAEQAVRSLSRMAAGFDDLYWASRRTAASVQNMKALGYAVSQLGGSYQGALQSIENFGKNLRNNPGYESLVKTLGVQTKDANGNLRDRVTIMRELAVQLNKMPRYVALQYMEALGIDEKTYEALKSGELVRYLEEYNKKTREMGVDQDRAAKIGKQLSDAWRGLDSTLQILGTRLLQEFGPSLERVVRAIDKFVQEHHDDIKNIFVEMGKAAEWLAEKFQELLQVIKPVWVNFDRIAQSLTGQSGLQVAFEAFAIFLVARWVPRILGAFAAVSTGFIGMLLKFGINPITLGMALGMGIDNKGAGAGEDAEIERQRRGGMWGGGAFDGSNAVRDDRNWWQRTMPKALGGKDPPLRRDPSGGAATTRPRNKLGAAQEGYDFWRSKGLSHAAALGIVANEDGESGFNPGAVGDGGRAFGLYQHHPDRRAAIFKGSGINMDLPNAQQQREGAHWEMTQGRHDPQARRAWRRLQGAQTPGEAADIFTRDFERPKFADRDAADRAGRANGWDKMIKKPEDTPKTPTEQKQEEKKLNLLQGTGVHGGGLGKLMNSMGRVGDNGGVSPEALAAARQRNRDALRAQIDAAQSAASTPITPGASSSSVSVNMNQETNIMVTGSGSPQETGAVVADEQKAVNGTLMRNMQGAVR